MTSREELIERAARAIFDMDGRPTMDSTRARISNETKEQVRAQARAALAVFEQAHAPTDDERDGMAKALCAIETRSKAATLEEAQVGIQRWMRHRYEAERLIEELADGGFEVRRSVQGEPSVTVATKPAIDEVRKVLDYYADEIDVSIWQEIASAVDDIPDCETWTAAPHAEHVQGEPTDAQVLAALEAYWGPQSTGFWFADQIKSMRAALRAAAATQEGERRG